MKPELMAAPQPPRLAPTFALTFDTELVWGSFDRIPVADFARRYPDIRGTVRDLLSLLGRYDVSATWAVVGHLFLSSCEREPGGLAHPELARPRQSWWQDDWYAVDPCTDRWRDPLWYGDDIVDMLLAARVPQEIGCHSFAHAPYGDPAMTAAAVNADLDACVAVAQRRGIALRSFVFPRNCEGHHEALLEHGFRAFRGADPTWFAGLPGALRRGAHLIDQAVGLAPPVSQPAERLPGLWNIPGSALLIHRHGLRRAISREARLRKAQAGLARVCSTGGVLHLWTHPFNVAQNREYMLLVLETVLREAAEARDRGELRIETMAQIAERLSAGARPDADAEQGRAATSSVAASLIP